MAEAIHAEPGNFSQVMETVEQHTPAEEDGGGGSVPLRPWRCWTCLENGGSCKLARDTAISSAIRRGCWTSTISPPVPRKAGERMKGEPDDGEESVAVNLRLTSA